MIFVVSAVVGLAMVLRAIPGQRMGHWWDFAPRFAILGVLATWLVLSLVSYLGVVSGRQVMSSPVGPPFAQDVVAALLAQSTLRRMRSPERGATLALGVVPDIHDWVQHFVARRVETWAEKLSDPKLVQVAGDLDATAKGIRQNATFTQRAAWRQERTDELELGGVHRDQARCDLVAMVSAAYSTYLLRRPR